MNFIRKTSLFLLLLLQTVYNSNAQQDVYALLQKVETTSNDSLKVHYLVDVAKAQRNKDSVSFYFDKAKKLALLLGNTFLQVYVDEQLGYAIIVENPHQTIRLFKKLEERLEKEEYLKRKFAAGICQALSIAYHNINKKKLSKIYANKIIYNSNTLKDSIMGIATIINWLDTLDYDSCHFYFNLGLKLLSRVEPPKVKARSQCDLLTNMGDYYIRTKKLKEAKTLYLQVLDVARAYQIKIFEMGAIASLGQIAAQLQQYEEAIKHFEQSLSFMKEVNRRIYFEELEEASECYAKLDNYKNAYKYLVMSNEVKAELENIEKQKMIEQLEAEYELNDKHEQLVAQELANKLKEERLRVEKREKYLLLGLFIISLGLFAWALLNYRNQRKLAVDLGKEKQKVEEQATELSRVNVMKDKLFAMIGHDLRSPINSLVMLVGDWKGYGINTVNSYKYMDKILHKLENVQLILNNLLEWATLHIKEIEPNIQVLNIEFFIKNMLNQFDTSFEEKKVVVLNKVNNLDILADESQLQIIIRNILSNAIKYSQESGYISISTSKTEDNVCLSIRDTGVGISEEKQKSIFDYPIPTVGTKGEKGTGIGLSLCRELIIKNKGHIELKSSVDKGTQVNIILPLHK